MSGDYLKLIHIRNGGHQMHGIPFSFSGNDGHPFAIAFSCEKISIPGGIGQLFSSLL
jgi:hypothetical protein